MISTSKHWQSTKGVVSNARKRVEFYQAMSLKVRGMGSYPILNIFRDPNLPSPLPSVNF